MPRGRPRQVASAVKEKVSMMEGVRRALKLMGPEAKPVDIQGFLKTNYDIEMNKSVISTYKSNIAKREAAKSAIVAQAAVDASAAMGLTVQDVETVKALAARLGANRIRDLVEVLTK